MAGRVNELTTSKYTAQLVDENGDNIQLADLDTLLLTLYDAQTGTVINSREGQDVLNNNGVVVSSIGYLTFVMEPEDNPIINDSVATELHKMLFMGTYAAGAKTLRHEFPFRVVNLSKVGG